VSEFTDLWVCASIISSVVYICFLGTKSLFPGGVCECVCVFERTLFDRHAWAGTSDHAAIRVHLGGLPLCREGSAPEWKPKLHRHKPKISIQQVSAVCACVHVYVCPNPKGSSSWSQSVDESNCQWRATCSWGPEILCFRVYVCVCVRACVRVCVCVCAWNFGCSFHHWAYTPLSFCLRRSWIAHHFKRPFYV